jgi:hypothetical protein
VHAAHRSFQRLIGSPDGRGHPPHAGGGLIDEDDNFELIEGRIVSMGPKYHAHERLKSELGMAFARVCPDDLIVGFETSLFLSPDTIVEPGLCIYPRRIRSEDVRGEDVLLAIEISAGQKRGSTPAMAFRNCG